MSGLMPEIVLLMNKKTFGLSVLLSLLVLSSALGQSPSPSVSPMAPSPSPESTVAAPVVKVRIVVRCDDAAVRTLVQNSLRTELAKLKNVAILSEGSSSLIVGVKLVLVTGVQVKSPLYAMELSLFDTPALFNALETVGLTRQTIYSLLLANAVQPIREDNVLTFVSKDQIPTKMASFIPMIEQHGIQRAQLAITMNQQRKPGANIDTNSVREDAP